MLNVFRILALILMQIFAFHSITGNIALSSPEVSHAIALPAASPPVLHNPGPIRMNGANITVEVFIPYASHEFISNGMPPAAAVSNLQPSSINPGNPHPPGIPPAGKVSHQKEDFETEEPQ